MQPKRGGLVPIREVVSGLDDALVTTVRDNSPQERRSFTVADQVNQLINASEADPDLGFMARTMALRSLPRSNPGNRLQYKRVNGPFKLVMGVTGDRNYSAKEWFVWAGTLLFGFGVLLLLLEIWFRWIFIPRINRATKEIKDVEVESGGGAL